MSEKMKDKENKAAKPVLIFSLLVIMIVGLTAAKGMSRSAPTYDGRKADADGVASIMVDQNNEKTAASNVVYSVVFNYRGYDTLGESFILIGALAGTAAILRKKSSKPSGGKNTAGTKAAEKTPEVRGNGGAQNVTEQHFHKKPVIVRCSSDFLLPLAIVYGWYIILHGAVSPGGGFQGGVLAASAVLLVYLAYGISGVKETFHPDFLHKSESAVEIFYVFVALTGVIAGIRFCYNFVFSGTEESAMLMNDAVGYHVMAGISCLLILMLGTLGTEDLYKPTRTETAAGAVPKAAAQTVEKAASPAMSGDAETAGKEPEQ